MSDELLNTRLRGLALELSRLQRLDPDAERLAGEIAAELARLGIPAKSGNPTAGGLESLAVHFEAEHPSAAAALRQAADLLGKAGI